VTCPACHRHLRFEALAPAQPAGKTICPFTLDGTIRHPGTGAACEYTVLIEVHDGGGETLARRVVNVGSLKSGEIRTITLRVEMLAPEHSSPPGAS
jgi:hypothetical protein